MRNITVFTASRAEYGLLYWLMKEIDAAAELQLSVLVSGMHLSPEFGLTYRQIEKDGFRIDEKVEMLLSSDTPASIVKSMGVGLLGFADALDRLKPDAIVILGDRFEAIAIAEAALIMRIPVVHLHGGEITEGAYDDAIRHAISKLSYLHFTATETYRQRVIQMGESPDRVFNVGGLGLDHVKQTPLLSLAELSGELQFKLDRPFFLSTYHPVTLADESPTMAFNALCEAFDRFPDHQIIFTYPNADDGGRQIIPLLHAYAARHPGRVLVEKSLGHVRYLSAVKHAAALVGNSSSGIIEAASFHTPAVDVGSRQQGRDRAASVIHAQSAADAIAHAITEAVQLAETDTRVFRNPYGEGGAAKAIVQVLQSAEMKVQKPFFDLPGARA